MRISPSARQWLPLAPFAALAVVLAFVPCVRCGTQEPPADGSSNGDGPAATPAARGRLVVMVRNARREPVAGARVQLLRVAGNRTRVVETGADGRAVLDALAEGAHALMVEAPGLARATAEARVAQAEGRVEVVLEPGARLAGSVVDDAGAALAGALVRVSRDPEPAGDSLAPWEKITAADGRWVFDTLSPGPLRVDVGAPGFEPTTRAIDPAATERDVRIVLRRTGAIAGRVLGADRAPAGGAVVVLAGSGVWPARSVTAGADGRFTLEGVPGGVYELRATRGDDVATPREGLFLEPGARAEVDLVLEPGATLEGVVIDADSETPLAGAELIVAEDALGFSPRAVRTGPDGTFRFAGLRAMPHRVSARAEGYVARVGEERTPGSPQRIGLRRAATLRGMVVDELDHPIAGVLLEVTGTGEGGEAIALTGFGATFTAALFQSQLAGPRPVTAAGELGVTLGEVPPIPLTPNAPAPMPTAVPGSSPAFATAADGTFTLTGIPPGRISITARHPLYATASTEPQTVRVGATVEDITLVLRTGGVIDGRVVDERGFPVASVRVELGGPREPYPRVTLAEADGTFRFDAVLGPVTLTAYPALLPAARVEAEVASNAVVPVTITLEGQLHALAGRTVDARGFPIAGVRIKVRGTRARSPLSTAIVSAEDGAFELTGLPAGPYRIVADHPDYAITVMPRVEATTGREERSVVLEPGGLVRGRVLDDHTGDPIQGARIRLETTRPVDSPLETLTLDSGEFEVPRLAAGSYTLSIDAPGHVSLTEPVQLRARRGEVDPVDLGDRRLAPAGSVSGEVIDQLGELVSGAEVAVTTESGADWARATRTDPRGRFTLAGIPAGRHWITARFPEAGEAEPVLVRIAPAEDTPGQLLRLPGRLPIP